jgi:hypothetical protein
MTYTAGSTIVATDYNEFAGSLNDVWATGSGDAGYGQTTVSTVAVAATVTATQWSSLNSKISSVASHQGTTITSRTNPTAGSTISILSDVAADLTSINTNRKNAAASGSQYTTITGTNSKTTTTGSGTASWTLTFTNTITFASANAFRWFFNAGGRIKLETSKTSTGTLADPEWNDLATTLMSDLFITGGGAATIAGTTYNGTYRSGGTGTPQTYNQFFGALNATTSNTLIYRQYADTAPYTGMNIQVFLKVNSATPTQLIVETLWSDPGAGAAYGEGVITGGTAASGATPGTAPCSIVTYYPPSTTYLTASWGTPTIAATVA